MSQWPVATLQSLAKTIELGFACSKTKLVASGLPHLRPFNIGTGCRLDLSSVYKITINEAPPSKRHLHAGDILFNNTNSLDLVGKTALVELNTDAGYSNHLTRINLDRSKCDPSFITYCLNWLWIQGYFRARATQWVSQAAFNGGALAGLCVPLPPLDEQRRIVDLLERAAGIRRLREQALAKARATVSALFLDLFGDPASNPRGWPVVSLGSLVAEFRYGTSTKCHDVRQDGDLPVLRIPNVIGDAVDWSDIKFCSLDARDAARLRLTDGDLLFVRTNGNPAYIGRSVIFTGPENAAFASYLIRARLSATAPATSLFVRETVNLSSYRPRLLQAAKTTAGNFNISIDGLSRLPIQLPPFELQHAFAERLAGLRSIIAQQERSLAAARELERSLMARLLG